MFVHLRKKVGKEMMAAVNGAVALKAQAETEALSTGKQMDDDDKKSGSGSKGPEQNKGKLMVDAACAPADITFPTDLKVLNSAREKVRRSLRFCTSRLP